MKESSYWAERFALLEEDLYALGAVYFERVRRAYEAAIVELEKELADWYMRYANDNKITYTEAKQRLTVGELAAFKMTVEEYIRKGSSLDPRWQKELKHASTKFHVSRLEAMKIQMQHRAEMLATETLDAIDEMAHKVYSEKYYRTAFELQKGVGVGFDVFKLSDSDIDVVSKKPWTWDGKHFSDRIWSDKVKLIHELDTTFTQAVIRGTDFRKTIAEISKRLNVKKSNVARLILTENKAIQSRADLDSYKDLGVTEYEILATLDLRTSQICRSMDGKRFKVSEFDIGVTAPPFHPYCRTTTTPYSEAVRAVFGKIATRAARDNERGYYLVPASMKYQEWYDTYVDKKQ